MRIHLAILLLPALVPMLAAVKTALSRGSYALQTCISKRECDFVVEEGDLSFVTFQSTDGKNRFDFATDYYKKTSSVTLSSFLGEAPKIQVLQAPINSVATPGSKIIMGQSPLWLLSLLLAIPFLIHASRQLRATRFPGSKVFANQKEITDPNDPG